MSSTPVNPNKALWEKGDFTRIAETVRESGEALVQRIGITEGHKVLDLGCRDGTTALPAAKLEHRFSPSPEGFVSPMTWGVESHVVERFTGAGVPADKVSFTRDTFTFNFGGPPARLVDEFRNYYGPTMNAFAAAEKNGQAANLQKELEELFGSQNTSTHATSIPVTFLRVTVAC